MLGATLAAQRRRPTCMTQQRAAVLESFARHRCSAILRTADPTAAGPALEAAARGGFQILEVTLTTPNALEHITSLRRRGDVTVGAGTVLTPEDAEAAAAAGAQFLVSPVTDPEVLAVAKQRDLVSVPGTMTPTEMLRAHRAGADMVKLFPGPAIGAPFVQAIRGPMPFLRVFPTHGVTEDNCRAWLEAGSFGVGFVGSLFDPADLQRRDFDAIEARARRMTAAVAQAGGRDGA